MNPREVMDAYKLNPKKSLGQNFMHDPNTIEKIVSTAELMPEDTVVEIGPGTGELTAVLAEYAKHALGLAARVGKPTGIGGVSENIENPTFATAVGLLLIDSEGVAERPMGKKGGVSMKNAQGFVSKIVARFKA